MNDLDAEIMELSDQEVRAAMMILASKHETDAWKTIDSVLVLTRKGR